MKRPVITLLTDFGRTDHYVAAMKGVILSICPEAQLVDVSHEIVAYAVGEAAFTVSQAWPWFPKGTIHLVVVDPGVGTARRPILAEAKGHRFIAPDNGVLTMVFDAAKVPRVREISAVRYFHQPVSQTFHGRDIFAPVAAYLAKGVSPAKFGSRIRDFLALESMKPTRVGPRTWVGTVLKIDHFGNLITNFDVKTWGAGNDTLEFMVGNRRVARTASSYAEVTSDELFVIAGSSGFLEISANQRSAAGDVSVQAGSVVELRLLSD